MMNDLITITTAEEAFRLIHPHFSWQQEEIHIIALNSRQQILGQRLLFRGSVDFCPVHPRDIFRFLILLNASGFILFHNHPSGSLVPSDADIRFTKKLVTLSRLMELKFFDHLILTQLGFKSLL